MALRRDLWGAFSIPFFILSLLMVSSGKKLSEVFSIQQKITTEQLCGENNTKYHHRVYETEH